VGQGRKSYGPATRTHGADFILHQRRSTASGSARVTGRPSRPGAGQLVAVDVRAALSACTWAGSSRSAVPGCQDVARRRALAHARQAVGNVVAPVGGGAGACLPPRGRDMPIQGEAAPGTLRRQFVLGL